FLAWADAAAAQAREAKSATATTAGVLAFVVCSAFGFDCIKLLTSARPCSGTSLRYWSSALSAALRRLAASAGASLRGLWAGADGLGCAALRPADCRPASPVEEVSTGVTGTTSVFDGGGTFVPPLSPAEGVPVLPCAVPPWVCVGAAGCSAAVGCGAGFESSVSAFGFTGSTLLPRVSAKARRPTT